MYEKYCSVGLRHHESNHSDNASPNFKEVVIVHLKINMFMKLFNTFWKTKENVFVT